MKVLRVSLQKSSFLGPAAVSSIVSSLENNRVEVCKVHSAVCRSTLPTTYVAMKRFTYLVPHKTP